MSEVKVHALQDIEKAISEMKGTSSNPAYDCGYAYGMVNAFWRANVITFEEHQSFMEKLKRVVRSQ